MQEGGMMERESWPHAEHMHMFPLLSLNPVWGAANAKKKSQIPLIVIALMKRHTLQQRGLNLRDRFLKPMHM